MTLRQYFLLMIFGTVISLTCLGLIIANTTPNEAGIFVLVGIYTALFFSSFGVATVLGLGFRLWKKKSNHFTPAQVEASFRQGLFLGTIMTAALILESRGNMNWWNLTLLIGAVSALEIIITGVQMKRK